MLKRLRLKFIGTAMLAIFIVFALLTAGINLAFRAVTVRSLDGTLAMLAENEGAMPRSAAPPEMPEGQPGGPWGPPVTPETPFETRFFTVRRDAGSGALRTELGFIAAVSAEEAEAYFRRADEERRDRGFIGQYRFLRVRGVDGDFIVFLDGTRQLYSLRSVLPVSLGAAFLALLLTFGLVVVFSRRSLAPVARSMESQKRFITDASHELKTPLTVISSHADILCMEDETNEWARGIRKEAARMASLVSDLVTLSRWDEDSPLREKYDFDLSSAVWDTLAPFRRLAEAKGKILKAEIEEGLRFTGDEGALQTAFSTLLENAVKYSLPESEITVRLTKTRRGARLETLNSCAPEALRDLNRLFDRFYRADPSRSRDLGGYGVGLSIAKAIVEAHGGKIAAESPAEGMIRFRITLPE